MTAAVPETPEETENESKSLPTTPISEWKVTQQNLIEEVIDARFAKLVENEKPAKKTTSRSSSNKTSDSSKS